MIQSLSCPACRHSIFFPKFPDNLELLCPACKHKYKLLYSKVLAFASTLEPVSQKFQKSSECRRSYSLRLQTTNQAVKALHFSMPEQAETLRALPGDELVLLHAMRNDQCQDLVCIINHTTGQHYRLFSPRSLSISAGLGTGIIVLAFGLLLSGALNGFAKNGLVAFSMPVAVGAGLYVMDRRNLRERNRRIILRLSSEQALLEQLFSARQRVEALKQELEGNQQVSQRLRRLQHRIEEAGIYGHRIETTNRALVLLEKQLVVSSDLIVGYEKISNLIEIEFETSRLAELLPQCLDGGTFRYWDELKTLEEEYEKLKLLFDAEQALEQ